jgi:hypothetical protein
MAMLPYVSRAGSSALEGMPVLGAVKLGCPSAVRRTG